MSDEVNSVQIGIEQILAAILHKVGRVSITQEELIADYSAYAVAVDPVDDITVSFSLVDAGVADENAG
jgi:hypothetical protein